MKVELVTVKISKLREVKKQLQRRRNRNEKNLKNLLIGEKIANRDNDILYKSINALFQNDSTHNESMNLTNSENSLPDYHIDFNEFLQSLEPIQKDTSPDDSSSYFSTQPLNNNIDETLVHTIDQTVENCSISYMIYKNNEGSEQGTDEIYLYNRVETESILWCSNGDPNAYANMIDTNDANLTLNGNINEVSDTNLNITESINDVGEENLNVTSNMNDIQDINFNTIAYLNDMSGTEFVKTENLNDSKIEPAMTELGQYYKPHTELISTNEETIIQQEAFFNEIKVPMTEMSETKEYSYQEFQDQLEHPVSVKEENILVDPKAINCSGVDLKMITMSQLQNQNQPVSDLEEIELLKNYDLEQKTNIITAARMLYTKRTRTLLHWLDPKLPLSKLKATLALSWKNLPVWQKEVYITQVLGPLMMDTVTPMLNPQLTPGGYAKVVPMLADKTHFKKRQSCMRKRESPEYFSTDSYPEEKDSSI